MRESRRQYRTWLAGLISILILTVSAGAATLTVTNTNDSLAGSLRQAISDAAPDDTITFSLPANSAITLRSSKVAINENPAIDGFPWFRRFTSSRSLHL